MISLKHVTIAVALTVSVLFLMGCTGGGSFFMKDKLIVGKDIAMQDITEFYYTYDASTFPPRFQRYRFSVKDGKHLFYHEKREGKTWPLREKHITVSGTKELSDEEWAKFFACVKDGIVEKRKEHLEDGDAGPWLFLYWKGDRGKYQEFSFVHLGARKEFEELCVTLKDAK
ncbi:MAG: hypothetical protein IJ056_05115 [Acidaminococcaceae bacterium]|nr:hypothetical protein [Acidaminococcaceae bacterium]